jgi:hypothetical protein
MKRNVRISSIPAALLALGLLILSGCFNLLSPAPEPEDRAGGGVVISVSGKPDAARTIYPRAEFSKIVLSFTPQDSQTAHDPVTLEDGQSSVVIDDLEDGSWEVSATGYVKIDANGDGSIETDEEFEAASSSAVPVTVSSGSAHVTITLSAAKTPGTAGYFSYSVSFPPAKVDTATLRFTDADGYSGVYDASNNYLGQIEKDLFAYPAGTISLEPGYYLMRIELENDYQRAGRTEIIHIYSDMETRADYTFTEADFTDFILLSGTVDIKINGNRPESATVYAYTAEPYGGQTYLGYGYVEWDTGSGSTGTWKIAILPSASPRNVTFEVYTWNNSSMYWESNVTRSVSNTSISGISIVIDKQTLTLSGTATITVNNNAFGTGNGEYIYLYLYDNPENNGESIGYANVNTDGTWSMVITKPASTVTYYFSVGAGRNGSNTTYRKQNVQTVSVSAADVPNITVAHNFTALSGTAAITVNDVPFGTGNNEYIYLYLYDNSENNGESIGYATVNSDGTWSMPLDEAPASGTYYFRVNAWKGEENYYLRNAAQINFSTDPYDNITITHNFSVVIMSGTVSVTINGTTASDLRVAAYESKTGNWSGNWYGGGPASPDGGGGGGGGPAPGSVSNGAWTITLSNPPASGTRIFFRVSYTYNGREYSYEPENIITIGGDTSNIALNGKTLITLSGSADFRVGGTPVSWYRLAAFNGSNLLGEGFAESSTGWSLLAESVSGTVSFDARLPTTADTDMVVRNVGTATVSGAAQAGISLSANTEVKNITVSVTPAVTSVYMLRSQFESADMNNNAAFWEKVIARGYKETPTAMFTIPVPTDTLNTVHFLVRIYGTDGYTTYTTTSAVDISSGSVSLNSGNLTEFPDN